MTYGDFVLVLPFLAELKQRYPGATITMVCGRRGAQLCRLYPCIDQVVNLNDLRPGVNLLRTFGQLLKLVGNELSYALHPLLFAGFVSFLLAGRKRIGFSQATVRLYSGPHGFEDKESVSRAGEWLLQHLLLHDSRRMQTRDFHASERFTQLLDGKSQTSQSLRGQLAAKYPQSQSNAKRIVLAPFSGWTPRNWPLDRWVHLAKLFIKSFPRTDIIVSVDPGTAKLAGIAFGQVAEAIVFVPGSDFDLLFRTFASARLIVSNDSFPLHAASALNIPSIGIFGPNLPHWFGGKSSAHEDLFSPIECNPCAQMQGNEPCLRGFSTCAALEIWSAEAVFARCLKMLEAESAAGT